MMTRKDYVAVSEILAEYAPGVYEVSWAEPELFRQMVGDFADYMEEDNPRFIRKKFIEECYSLASAYSQAVVTQN
jgi:hypothetical protein